MSRARQTRCSCEAGEAVPGEQEATAGAGADRAALHAAAPRPAPARPARRRAPPAGCGSTARWCEAVARDGYDAVSVRQVIALAGRLAPLLLRAVRQQAGVLPGHLRPARDRRQMRGGERVRLTAAAAPDRRLAAALDSCARASPARARTRGARAARFAGRGRRPARCASRAAAAAWERLLAPRSPAARSRRPPPGASISSAARWHCRGSWRRGCASRRPVRRARRASCAGGRSHRSCRRAPQGRSAGSPRCVAATSARRASPAAAPAPPAAGRRAPERDRERLLAAALRLAARDPVALLSAPQICRRGRGAARRRSSSCSTTATSACARRSRRPASGCSRSPSALPRAGPGLAAARLRAPSRRCSRICREPAAGAGADRARSCAGAELPPATGAALDGELARLLGDRPDPSGGEPARRRRVVGALWHLVRCHLRMTARIRLTLLRRAVLADLALFALAPGARRPSCSAAEAARSTDAARRASSGACARRSAKYVSTIPTSSEITITMISGAWPEPNTQSTLTSSRFRTANSVMRIASTTIAPVRASLLAAPLRRRRLWRRPAGCGSRAWTSAGVIVAARAGAAARAATCSRAARAANTMGCDATTARRSPSLGAGPAGRLRLADQDRDRRQRAAAASTRRRTRARDGTAHARRRRTTTTTAEHRLEAPQHHAHRPRAVVRRTRKERQAGPLGAAVAVVRAHGYTPDDTSEYHPGQTLRVLVGTRTGSGDGYGQQAFFFVDGRYIGTDTKEPSATAEGRLARTTPKSRSPIRSTAAATRCAAPAAARRRALRSSTTANCTRSTRSRRRARAA